MTTTRSHDRTDHRAARRHGLRLAAGAAIAWIVPVASLAQAKKLDRAAVQYVDRGKDPGKDCDDCAQFVPGPDPTAMGTCRIVEGPISPHGHCIAFTPKTPARRP
jgi:hypothetical protein